MLQRIHSNQPQLKDRVKDLAKITEIVRASKTKARQVTKTAEVSGEERTEEQDQPWYQLMPEESQRDVQRTKPAARDADSWAGTDSAQFTVSMSASQHVHTQSVLMVIAAGIGAAYPEQLYQDTSGIDVDAASGQLPAIALPVEMLPVMYS